MVHRDRFQGLPIAVLLCALAACVPQPLTITREPVTLRLVVADSCASLAEPLAASYEESHPWVTIPLEAFNSATAEQMLRADEADLAILSWSGQDEEGSLWTEPFARDGLAVIVHPTMPITETGLALLHEVFRGRMQEMKGTVLVVVSREEGSGTRAAFDSAVLGNQDVTRTAVVMPSDDAVVEYVARTPGAIGYVSTRRLADPTVSGVRVLPVEGVSPTRTAIADGRYALQRSLYLATVGEPTGGARDFAQWVLGPEGQVIVGELVER